MPLFSHLHVHTQFSLLDGAAPIDALLAKAAKDKMPALAITDHGNMFGAFEFVAKAAQHGVKPIVGCEFYVVEDRMKRQFTREQKDRRFHQLLLARNATGYRNLIKLCSLGYIEGLYGKYPRIDKDLLVRYREGLIATTCCLGAMVPQAVLRKGEAEAEAEFKWWLDLFGDDYYVELQRHGMAEQDRVNRVLLGFAARHGVRVIASNDSHYVDREDYNAHDILLCINTGEKKSTPSLREFADDDVQVKGKRFAFYNDEFYFKTTDEMASLFADVPEAIDNTNEIVGKVDLLNLKNDILLPHFTIPDGFATQDDYLEYLAMTGARNRYGERLTPEIEERIRFELNTIRNMGFAGYFLIVADFINHGREIGVMVGPGRGSAAGSAVAYCIGITNIDPVKYNLLFERFLNPDRKSMPDIDTDFDDAGRQKVIEYVVRKYGRQQVAQIVTFGTMAARLSIRDVARVLDYPLSDTNQLAKLVPERPGISLKAILRDPMDNLKWLGSDELSDVKKLRDVLHGKDLPADVLREAMVLEGSVRNTGIHAAGIIIAPKDLTEIIPVATSKETDLLITQFEGKTIQDAGVIKMDFLGLKTLTILRDAVQMIRQNRGVEIDLDAVPLDDVKTFGLYQRGETNGTFQFESAGMQKYLKELKPDKFEDLIAMNALYRPGPMEYIPLYVRRKHGHEKVVYDLPGTEEYLEETYGVTVYQEQVMLLSQKLAGFSKGDADVLRKAMGKKQRAVLDKMKDKFMQGALANGYPEDKLLKIWTDWEAFAEYAFNKSHSTCYAFVAFQTAYLKAHYPAEYMASVLTHNLSNIDKITFFMEECRRMKIPVLGPDVNESRFHFSVNPKGEIRFGLGAIKGVGEAAVQAIVEERQAGGPFANLFDLMARVSMRNVNKKTLEGLVKAGALDGFGEFHRAQYLAGETNGATGLDKVIRYASGVQDARNRNQQSLFDDAGHDVEEPLPALPAVEPWSVLEKLRHEKDVIGFYVSGHPLDLFRYELKTFCTHTVRDIADESQWRKLSQRGPFVFAGMVTRVNHRIGKTGKRFGIFTLEDLTGSIELPLWNEKKYLEFEKYLKEEMFLLVRAVTQTRFHSETEYEISIQDIRLLSQAGPELTRSVTLITPTRSVNDQWLQRIGALVRAHPGTIPLRITLRDDQLRAEVKAGSRKLRVHFDKDLFEELEAIDDLELRING